MSKGNILRTPTWDDYFMSMVYLIASKSKDERTHIGAVVIGPDKEIKTTGYNSFVRRLKDDIPERQEKPEKYFWFEHAERNAIFYAAKYGVSLNNCKLYVQGTPCMDCARAIVQSGIKKVIIHKKWDDMFEDIWLEHKKRTLMLFEEAEITLKVWDGELIELFSFFRGEKNIF